MLGEGRRRSEQRGVRSSFPLGLEKVITSQAAPALMAGGCTEVSRVTEDSLDLCTPLSSWVLEGEPGCFRLS